MIGKNFGRLIVVSELETRSKHGFRIYSCICACGKVKEISGHSLRAGKTKSCGCLQKELRVKHGKANRGPAGDVTLNCLETAMRRSAKHRGIVCSLTKEQFRQIITKDCFYCGEAPKRTNYYMKVAQEKYSRFYSDYTYSQRRAMSPEMADRQWVNANGIDRKDNAIGYTLDNSVACCFRCNVTKLDGSVEEFIAHCRKIVEFQDRNKNVEAQSN